MTSVVGGCNDVDLSQRTYMNDVPEIVQPSYQLANTFSLVIQCRDLDGR